MIEKQAMRLYLVLLCVNLKNMFTGLIVRPSAMQFDGEGQIHGQTDRQTFSQRDGWTDRQTACDELKHCGLLQVMEQEIVVKPGDSDIVRLSILPLKPGLLRITGLEWVLNGQAQGRRLFAAKAPQHRRTGSRY